MSEGNGTTPPNEHLKPSIATDGFRNDALVSIPEISPTIDTSDEYDNRRFVLSGMSATYRMIANWSLGRDLLGPENTDISYQSIIVRVSGDSMLPSYSEGDRVIVDLTQSSLLHDSVYVIANDDWSLEVRRLQRMFRSKPERAKIICDNHLYPTEEIPLSEVKIVGRVCGVIARR